MKKTYESVCIGKYLWGVAYVLRVGKVEKGQPWALAQSIQARIQWTVGQELQ